MFISSLKSFSASLYSDENGKIKITNGEQADKIEADLQNAEYIITKVKNGTRKKSPAPPFITSTLQQEASRKLGFQSRRTMKVAQELYEGVGCNRSYHLYENRLTQNFKCCN